MCAVPVVRKQAVELANRLRDHMGTDALAVIRENHGGLLTLLEKHPALFHVDRIPKNDTVMLIATSRVLEVGVCGGRVWGPHQPERMFVCVVCVVCHPPAQVAVVGCLPCVVCDAICPTACCLLSAAY